MNAPDLPVPQEIFPELPIQQAIFPDRQPPEYTGIEDMLKYLARTVWEIREEQAADRSIRDLKTYTLKDLTDAFHSKPGFFKNRPWLIPNYGRPDVGMRPARWFYKTVMDWYNIPEQERREKWEMMGSYERRKAMGTIA
jgi:hypothetical protein